jgi:hypothetical protein
MTLQEILQTHPQSAVDYSAITRCVEECFRCAATCTSCADACLAEPNVTELVRCIRLNLDCADVCAATACIVTRQTTGESTFVRDLLLACATACRLCAAECERHAEHHKHCRICAEACNRCEQACQDLLSTLP